MAKTKAQQPAPGYKALKEELDTIMAGLQREDLDVDTALQHYQRGLELVKAMEQHLKTAENKISQLKTKFNSPAA